MNYKDLVEQSTRIGYNHSIGGRILQLMKNLRQKANPHSERRWVWELLQNGKDVSQVGIPFKVEINLKQTKGEQPALEFKHNGKPFTVKDITFLVEQVSTKEQAKPGQNPDTIGKFGSGFLTTHLLSEKVTVKTVVMDQGLDTKECTVLLDRSPRDKDGIIASVEKSLETLTQLDSLPTYTGYDRRAYNTNFRYELDAKGITVAKQGIEDLIRSIPYTLVFVPEIRQVDIPSDLHDFRILAEQTVVDGDVTFYTVEDNQLFETEYTHLAVVKGKTVDIAVPIDRQADTISLKTLGDKIPKLFCDYPLVGSENFPFPVVVNSRLFNPDDPRSYVLLNDADDPEINQNKALMDEAVKLYGKLLTYCASHDVQHMYELARFDRQVSLDWINKDWYKAHIADPIHAMLSTKKIIDNAAGKRVAALENDQPKIYFPWATTPRVRKMLYDLAVKWFPESVPQEQDIAEWAAVIWPGCYKLNLQHLAQRIVNLRKLFALELSLQPGEDALDWLNEYYEALNLEGVFIKSVISNEFAVLPNQNGDFVTMTELFFDQSIPEIIKDNLFTLGNDIRAELRDNRLYTANKEDQNSKVQIVHSSKKQKAVYADLNSLLKEAGSSTAAAVAIKQTCIFSKDGKTPAIREKIYDFAYTIYPDEKMDKVFIPTYDELIWEQSDRILFSNICEKIALETTVSEMTATYQFDTEQDTIDWLVEFSEMLIAQGFEYLLNDEEHPILPNQNGTMCSKEQLSLGDNTSDELKDIAAKLGYDFRDILIDDTFAINFPDTRTINNQGIAEKIVALVNEIFTNSSDTEDNQAVLHQLYVWLNQHATLAKKYFGEFYKNRHRLCDAAEITSSIEKAATLDTIMAGLGVTTPEEVMELLSKRQAADAEAPPALMPLAQEILVSLGVQSPEELVVALEDKTLSDLFGHTSVPTIEAFMFVQSMLTRSKRRIKAFLETEGYDFSQADEIATTIFSGVIKDGRQLNIVCRPSDGGEVIFYFGSEKDTLEELETELWIENGIDNPELLTLGRILKSNGIIKVKID